MTRELRQSSQEVSAYMNPRKRVVQTFSLWTSIHTFIQVNILILPLWPLTLKLDNPSYYFLWCLLFIILTNREERLPFMAQYHEIVYLESSLQPSPDATVIILSPVCWMHEACPVLGSVFQLADWLILTYPSGRVRNKTRTRFQTEIWKQWLDLIVVWTAMIVTGDARILV